MSSGALRNALLPLLARKIQPTAGGDPDHILILQPDHLGDIILSEPAVRLLRERLPGARLTGVVGPWSTRIAALAWPVDDVVAVDFPGFDRLAGRRNPAMPYQRLFETVDRLRRLGAGRAVVLRDDAWWATALARGSVSGAVAAADDPRNLPFASVAADLTAHEHRTARALTIAAAILAYSNDPGRLNVWDMSPRLATRPEQTDEARELLARTGVDGPYIAVHPGAGAAVKTWPASRWRALISTFAEHRFVLTGTEDEINECRDSADGLANAVNVAGKTTLDSLIGLLAGARLAMGTDNGPMHIAAALGTPTVRLYGPSNPRKYGPPPGDSRHRVVTAGWSCPRCEDLSPSRDAGCGCMTAISVAALAAALEDGLNDAA